MGSSESLPSVHARSGPSRPVVRRDVHRAVADLGAARRRRADGALRADWRLLAAAGIAFAGDLAFWHWSIQFTSVANSTLLANLASIFVTLAAWVLWRQQPSAMFVAGLAAALAGGGLLVRARLGFSPSALLRGR